MIYEKMGEDEIMQRMEKLERDISALWETFNALQLTVHQQRVRILVSKPGYHQTILLAKESLEVWRHQDATSAGKTDDIQGGSISLPRNHLARGCNVVASLKAIQQQLLDTGSTNWGLTFEKTYNVDHTVVNRLLADMPNVLIEILNLRADIVRRKHWETKDQAMKDRLRVEAELMWQSWQIKAETAQSNGANVPDLDTTEDLACRSLIARFYAEDRATQFDCCLDVEKGGRTRSTMAPKNQSS